MKNSTVKTCKLILLEVKVPHNELRWVVVTMNNEKIQFNSDEGASTKSCLLKKGNFEFRAWAEQGFFSALSDTLHPLEPPPRDWQPYHDAS